jgi:hypothetical protein
MPRHRPDGHAIIAHPNPAQLTDAAWLNSSVLWRLWNSENSKANRIETEKVPRNLDKSVRRVEEK